MLTEIQLRKLNQERGGGHLEEKLKRKGVWDRLGTELQNEIRYWKNLLINESKENENKKKDVLFHCREIKKLEEKVETLRNRGDDYKNKLTQFKDRFYKLLGPSPEIRENLESRGGNLFHQIDSLNIQVRNLKTELDTSKKIKDEKILQLGNENLLLLNKNKNQAEIYSRLENQISIIQQLAEAEIIILEREKNNFRNKFGKTSKSFKNYKKNSAKKSEQLTYEIKQLKSCLWKEKSLRKSEQKKLIKKQKQLDKSKDKVRIVNKNFLQLLKELRKEKYDHQKTQQENNNYYFQLNQAKTENDNLKNKLMEKERIIQKQVQKIKELENKPPLTATKTQIVEKEKIKQVEKEKLVPFGENLTKIIEIDLYGLEKELKIELPPEIRQQIKKSSSYQELSSLRNKEIKKYLKQNGIVISQNKLATVPKFGRERLIWISLLVLSLLTIGGLVVKIKQSKGKKKKKRARLVQNNFF